MNQQLRSSVELFADNVQALKGTFIWKSILIKRLAALLFAAKGRQIDIDALQESHDLIKESTNAFSYFRGNCGLTVATLLSLHESRRTQLANSIAVYDRMKAHKFRSSDYLIVAAYQIAANADKENYDEVITRAKAFYDGMKAEHRLVTGQNDYIFAALLGLSDLALESGLGRIEELYQTFKPHFRPADSVQALAQALTLSAADHEDVARVLDLCGKFRKRGMRLDRPYTLPSLGILSMLPVDADRLVSEVIETGRLLRTKKGFGRMTVSRQELLLLCAALVCFGYVSEQGSHLLTTALSTGITNIIIAQQTAIAVAAASSAAASASS